jgi:hypothetical protein
MTLMSAALPPDEPVTSPVVLWTAVLHDAAHQAVDAIEQSFVIRHSSASQTRNYKPPTPTNHHNQLGSKGLRGRQNVHRSTFPVRKLIFCCVLTVALFDDDDGHKND